MGNEILQEISPLVKAKRKPQVLHLISITVFIIEGSFLPLNTNLQPEQSSFDIIGF